MNENEFLICVKAAFDANPKVDHLYVTYDGQAFFNGSSASNHGRNLAKEGKSADSIKVFRDQLDALQTEAEVNPNEVSMFIEPPLIDNVPPIGDKVDVETTSPVDGDLSSETVSSIKSAKKGKKGK